MRGVFIFFQVKTIKVAKKKKQDIIFFTAS